MINLRNTVESNNLYKIREDFSNAKRFYLLNRSNIQADDLSRLLPTLEQKINEKTTVEQFNSFYLFLKLCFRYQDKLPDSFSEFKDVDVLAKKFLALKESSLFKVQTTRGDKNFIENAIKKLMPVSKIGKGVSSEQIEKKIEKSKTFSSTGKNLLAVFSETLSKTDFPIEKSGENNIKQVEKTKKESAVLLISVSPTVFGKKRKLDEIGGMADQSLTEGNQSPSEPNQRTITSSRSPSSVNN